MKWGIRLSGDPEIGDPVIGISVVNIESWFRINGSRIPVPDERIDRITFIPMNLIIDPNPKADQHSVNGTLAKRLAEHFKDPSQTIRLYDSDQKYFNYEFNDEWIDLVVKAKRLIFPVPMWNFMIPASLKDFFDKTCKRGQFWDFDAEKKYIGLLQGKSAYIILTSGDNHLPNSPADFLIPYLRYMLKFLGIHEIYDFRLGGVRNRSLSSDQAYMDEKTAEMLKAFQLTY